MKAMTLISSILLLFASTTYASVAHELEGLLLSKDWRGVYSALAELKPNSMKEAEHNRKLTDASKAILNFLRDCDTFMSLNDKSAQSFKVALKNDYRSIPRKLPFSQKLIDEINARKAETDKRFVQIEENKRKEREEAAVRKKEIERQHKEAEQLAEQKKKDYLIQKEKEKRDHEQYLTVQDEIERSPVYKKSELICRICTAIKNNKDIEKYLATDLSYSKKYKVINLSRRDQAVQEIKNNDSIIRIGKSEYKNLLGRPFAPSNCNQINCDDCEVNLEKLSKALTDQKINQLNETADHAESTR